MGYILRLFDNLQHVVKATGMNIGYRNPQRNQPCTIIPALLRNVQVSPAAVNAWSVWGQITAGEAADLIIAACHYGFIVGNNNIYHFQIGTGAAGAEVPIIEWEDGTVVSGAATPVAARARQLPYVHIPAGTRLAIRGYDENAGPNHGGFGFYLCYLPYNGLTWDTWDDRYPKGNRSQGSFRTPAVGSPYIALPNGAPGAWVTVVASAAQECLITAVQHDIANAPTWFQLDIAIGAVGSEVIQEKVASPSTQTVIGTWGNMELCRTVRVHAGERIAMRQAASAAAVNVNVAMTLENILA